MRTWKFYKIAENGFLYLYFKSETNDLLLSIYQLESSGKKLNDIVKIELT